MIDFKNLHRLQTIYLLRNLKNSKEYIGKANDLYDRFNHSYPNEIKWKENRPIINSINEHGWENFEMEILHWWDETVSNDEVLALETAYIDEYKTLNIHGGYNVCLFGNDKTGCRGFKHKPKAKELMSKNRTGITNGEKHFNYGKHLPDKTKENISNALKGRVITPEWRQKISDNNAGKTSVKQIDKMTGQAIKIWNSMIEAVKFLFPDKINKSAIVGDICKCCKKQRPSAYGFKWEYV